jgi:hypothetical protein
MTMSSPDADASPSSKAFKAVDDTMMYAMIGADDRCRRHGEVRTPILEGSRMRCLAPRIVQVQE